MKEVFGDLWTYPTEYQAVPTNGIVNSHGRLVMGRGVALEAARSYPELPGILGKAVKHGGNFPYLVKKYHLVSFPTKGDWREKSCLLLIEESAIRLVRLVQENCIKSVGLPQVGCGNGGLLWESQVRPILLKYFDDRFTVVSPDIFSTGGGV